MMWWSIKAKSSQKSSQKLSEVNDSRSKGHFGALPKRAAHPSLLEWPLGKTIGLEAKYSELCECFERDEVGIICVYGMGGVGKTTLLKKFHNEFLSTTQHDVVIWVEGALPKEGHVAKIQEIIKTKSNIREDVWKNKTINERADIIYYILKRRNFVLIIDDLRLQIDLLELGVPHPKDGVSKIIVSTRDMETCRWVGAKKFIKVDILSPAKAFELFKETVGEDVTSSNSRINKLAKLMSNECKGLPLALIEVGKSMLLKTSIKEWERALETLKSYPSVFPGMVDHVYHRLEFSYNRLPYDYFKSCFLYCSLFPEDYNLDEEELILLWIAEGFLAEFDGNIHVARNQGRYIISSLKQASLLEDGFTKGYVKVHNIIRHMALWLACEYDSKIRFVMKDNAATSYPKRWKEVEKLSLWGAKWGRGPTLQDFFEKYRCSNFLTLFIRNFSKLYFEAFELPITIKVLDMTNNKSSSSLLLTIGRFVNLEYLNISNSPLIKLTEQLKDLKKLKYLLLNDITHLEFPRQGVICNLSSLQAFSMLRSHNPYCDESVLLDELESLKQLENTRISVHSSSSFEKILKSPKLQRCICELDVSCILGKSSLQMFGRFLITLFHLETLVISDKTNQSVEAFEAENILRGFFQSVDCTIPLCKLVISKWRIFDLDWLKLAPKLEYLELNECDLLEEIVTEDYWADDDLGTDVFCSLTELILKDLSRLKSICCRALGCRFLEVVCVRGCPNLRKLPFNCHSGALKSLKLFMGEPDWVDQLEWEDEVTKNLFLTNFEPL